MNYEVVYKRHMDAVKDGEITIFSKDRIFKDLKDLGDHLNNEGLSSTLVQQCASYSLGTAQEIGFWTLLDFSSDRAEAEFKAGFLRVLKRTGYPNEL